VADAARAARDERHLACEGETAHVERLTRAVEVVASSRSGSPGAAVTSTMGWPAPARSREFVGRLTPGTLAEC
jgi:hypothetical protein